MNSSRIEILEDYHAADPTRKAQVAPKAAAHSAPPSPQKEAQQSPTPRTVLLELSQWPSVTQAKIMKTFGLSKTQAWKVLQVYRSQYIEDVVQGRKSLRSAYDVIQKSREADTAFAALVRTADPPGRDTIVNALAALAADGTIRPSIHKRLLSRIPQ